MDRLTAALKRFIPRPVQPIIARPYHALYRRLIPLHWWFSDRFERTAAPEGLPLPPARLRFHVGESANAALFFRVGEATADCIHEAVTRAGASLTQSCVALDFGCGCGRTLMWLNRRFPEVAWHGADVDTQAIDWCRAHLPAASFIVNQPLPPLPFPDRRFDLIYGISVFTHLDEPYQRAWLAEFRRILKPGGLVLLSFYGRDSWQHLDQASAIERGAFVFCRSQKLRGILPEWYHTAFQSQQRIVEMLSAHFVDVDYVERGAGYQDLAVARRA